jgi:hypothetical protein
VLLDGDKEGRLQRKRYEQSFGSILSGCCVLLPDLCGEVLEAEDLLTAADRQTAIRAVFAEGDELPRPKKALSQAIVELYARREAITLDPSSTARIEQLLSMLARALAGRAEA